MAKLDEVGIRRGVVLSDAYYFDAVRPEPVPDEYDKVRAENDWTAQQVERPLQWRPRTRTECR